RLRALEPSRVISLEKRSALLDEELARAGQSAARRLGFEAAPVFTYLANTIRAGGREVPYSLVSAMDLGALGATEAAANAILLNEWAARDLEAKPGDAVTLEFYVWKDDGRLETESASFQFAGAVPIAGIAAGRDLAPEYPGISGAESLDNWDPPFPMDLGRVRPADEDYWDRYRTTPKAFLPLARGQQLWRSRFGSLTSLRVAAPEGRTLEETSSAFEGELRSSLDLARRGLALRPARAQALEAAQGATDFGRYFAYFSFFLVVSALLLAWLFFKLGVEQRLREIGVLLAIGIPRRKVGDLFLREGLALAVAGGLAGAAGAVAYAWLILLGLRTVWVDAVGTRLIELHVSGGTLAAGAQAGVAVALAAIIWTLRGLRGRTTRELLAGALPPAPPSRPLATWQAVLALASLITAGLLIAGAATGRVLEVPAFFTAGTLLLIGALLFQKLWLARNRAGPLRSIAALGFRNASARPGRSALCIALIASAAYILVAVEAFRRPPGPAGLDEFPLMAESLLPIVHNPNLDLNLSRVPLEGVRFVPFRLRPGDDASCLNLYQPREPRVLGAPESFLLSHPWLLLRQPLPDGAIPALADANSLQYALHLKVGDSVEIGGRKLRIVAALEDSIFQSELIVSEPGFLRAFPEQEGFRFFLIQAKPEISGPLEEALADYGFDVTPTAERLAGFHRVENTYISTFQALGALGLLLGTVGLAAVLLRNALERRRELALLEAVGFRGRSLKWMVLVENGLLLVLGLL
ncbi:MAG: ABC transporter permease, partial [Acidobacteria bacterium]|nr:ABC transporter permease [Acidobacteriota bacterium]